MCYSLLQHPVQVIGRWWRVIPIRVLYLILILLAFPLAQTNPYSINIIIHQLLLLASSALCWIWFVSLILRFTTHTEDSTSSIPLLLQTPVDGDIDFDSMSLDTQARWLQPPKLELSQESQKKGEMRCTMYRFSSEPMDSSNPNKMESETKVKEESPKRIQCSSFEV